MRLTKLFEQARDKLQDAQARRKRDFGKHTCKQEVPKKYNSAGVRRRHKLQVKADGPYRLFISTMNTLTIERDGLVETVPRDRVSWGPPSPADDDVSQPVDTTEHSSAEVSFQDAPGSLPQIIPEKVFADKTTTLGNDDASDGRRSRARRTVPASKPAKKGILSRSYWSTTAQQTYSETAGSGSTSTMILGSQLVTVYTISWRHFSVA